MKDIGRNHQHLRWVIGNTGLIPVGAIQCGFDWGNEPLYIARAHYNGGLHVGKVGRHFTGCNISYAGKEVCVENYEVLTIDCGYTLEDFARWVPCQETFDSHHFHGHPLIGGYESSGPLYIARGVHQGVTVLGKCSDHLKGGIFYPYGHEEHIGKYYEVLTLNYHEE